MFSIFFHVIYKNVGWDRIVDGGLEQPSRFIRMNSMVGLFCRVMEPPV